MREESSRRGVIRTRWVSHSILALLLVVSFFQSSISLVSARTLSLEMHFKKADEMEKAERLRRLHLFQSSQLEAEEEAAERDEQAEQVAQLISNRGGKSGSFPGDFTSKSSLVTAPISFGGQTFEVTLDTGSTILWITSATCKSTACKSHKQYDASNSSSFAFFSPRVDFEVEYGSGLVHGSLATERVGLGDLFVPSQTFGLVTLQEGSTFETAQWSGLLGLAYPSLAAFETLEKNLTTPFFDAIMAQNQLNHNAFSFWLVRSTVTPPMFFMGAPPPQYYKGKLEFFDVVDQYYWTIHLEDILVDGVSLGLCPPPQRCRAVVDSGTTYMSSPTKDLPTLLKAVSGDNADAACLSQTNKVITYVLDGGRQLTLEPDYYFTRSYTSEYCKVKYIGLDVEAPHGPVHIFGEVLFRKYFVHFDRDSDRVGFAPARDAAVESQSLQNLIIQKLYST